MVAKTADIIRSAIGGELARLHSEREVAVLWGARSSEDARAAIRADRSYQMFKRSHDAIIEALNGEVA